MGEDERRVMMWGKKEGISRWLLSVDWRDGLQAKQSGYLSLCQSWKWQNRNQYCDQNECLVFHLCACPTLSPLLPCQTHSWFWGVKSLMDNPKHLSETNRIHGGFSTLRVSDFEVCSRLRCQASGLYCCQVIKDIFTPFSILCMSSHICRLAW